MKNEPIKRHTALQNLSREHHDILVFALRLQKGIAKKTELKPMQDYCNWFWETYLQTHFRLEEENLFVLLNPEHELIQRAKQEHLELISHFEKTFKTEANLTQLYQLLQKHIRFEERILFNYLQTHTSEDQLEAFQKSHRKQQFCGHWSRAFWK